MALNIQTILQAKWPEIVVAQTATEKASHLPAKLGYTVVDQLLVNVVIDVHVYL